MMPVGQIRERLVKIETVIDDAARACQTGQNVPDELRRTIDELERESDSAKQMAQTESAEDRFLDCVDRLEEIGDRAKRYCNEARVLDQRVQQAVTQAHDMISTLKHELH
ncbi:hypothetical protein SAMN06265795_10933 [Noviherbaspirillum humi]|uniref:Uncharacterized protein n=2 Tax=Noviherbaspirillum humi TaxID=1688639 RepID=A0A239IAQ5_9BURK|nr:hypothetical protein SAMN06265795_10933 [Noviherbaspirillum humi]